MQSVLITGASGLLGSNLCRDLSGDYRIFATRHRTAVPENVVEAVSWDMTGSIKTLANWLKKKPVNAIIHCAALSKPGQCAANPARAKVMNVEATRELALIAAQNRIPFMFISTDLIYNSGHGPHSENDADPGIVYSETKFDAEIELFMVCPSAVVLRCALMFGPDNGINGSFLRENQQDLDSGKHLRLFTDQIRSPVWSRDISDAVDRVLKMRIRGRLFNAGGSTPISRYDLGMIAARYFGWDENRIIPVQMSMVIDTAPFLKDCSLDSSRLEKETGWHPTPLKDALKAVASEWNADH